MPHQYRTIFTGVEGQVVGAPRQLLDSKGVARARLSSYRSVHAAQERAHVNLCGVRHTSIARPCTAMTNREMGARCVASPAASAGSLNYSLSSLLHLNSPNACTQPKRLIESFRGHRQAALEVEKNLLRPGDVSYEAMCGVDTHTGIAYKNSAPQHRSRAER